MPSPTDARRTFAAGEIIMRQGDAGDCAYIIEEGQVEVFIEKPDGKIVPVATRGPGTIVGEMAIVDKAPRVATVKALKDCKMLEITQADFALRLKTTDPVIQMVSQVILARYRDTLKRVEMFTQNDAWPPIEAMEREYTAQTDVMGSVKIANEFREALEKGQLQMHYQPIVDLARGQVAGFESLMRWPHPAQGFISPGIFIPIAEKTGYIVTASKWALEESCKALRRIEDAVKPPKPLYMSVNFSSHDFVQEDFLNSVLKIISDAGVEPSQIKLEITERLLIQQPENARETLEACRDAGIGIYIDDFGTGYSSLSYLYYFPIQTLKVDQSFIRIMNKDPRSLELVRSIVGLGKNLNMNVIAEGVENPEEARLLRSMGCDMAQGYFYSKPMPEAEVIKKLNAWTPQRATGS
ncbi:MAG TPA: EAL domain-containing protein [Patescibacteria group bacterium]|nr:EAL domain-containing protein [Patescibacteria group bacterium]